MKVALALAAALLVALIALSGATTTISNRKQQCGQVVEGRKFQACQEFLSPWSQSRYPGTEHEPLEECCRSLKEMERRGCACDAIEQAAKQVGGHTQKVYEMAHDLPDTCRLKKTKKCQFQLLDA